MHQHLALEPTTSLSYWDGDKLNQYYTSPLYTQKVTFTITDPKGVVRTLQVVKSEK